MPRHELLLLASSGLGDDKISRVSAIARQAFPGLTAIRQRGDDPKSWPKGPNKMFQTAVEWVKGRNRAFIWIEPDCVPTVPGWLDTLEADYVKRAIPFYGVIWDKPLKHLNGAAIYPANLANINPFMVGASDLPFDCVRPELTLRKAYNSPLMQRTLADPSKNLPMDFPDFSSLSVIRPGVVLFHGNKNGDLIKRLREQRAVQPNGKPSFKSSLKKLFSKPAKVEKKTITVRRTGAIGDAIAATCVATKLSDQGYKVIFQTAPACREVLKYLKPSISLADPVGKCDVMLDRVYEDDPKRTSKHFAEMFIEAANRQIKGVTLKPINFAPTLKAKTKLINVLDAPRPWVAFVPRSNSFLERTIPDKVWIEAERDIDATCFWFGTHPSPHANIKQVPLERVTELLSLGTMDLVVSPDTGPAHISVALGVPTIVISQSSAPELHLSDQRDWCSIKPDNLDCLNCQATCRIDPSNPPCQWIDSYAISTAVNKRLRGMATDSVSAIVPIFRPPAKRLNECLTAVVNQVDEVVVTRDSNGIVPVGAMVHPRIKYVTARLGGIGYGRNLNHGMRHTNSRFCLALNDDVVLSHDAVSELLKAINSQEKVGAVGHLLFYPGRKTIQHGGTRRVNGDIGWGHLDHHATKPTIQGTVECENVTWASVLLNRKAFYEIGGMNEDIFAYFDDNFANLLLRQHGWKILYTSTASGEHDEHSTSKHNPEMAAHVKHSHEVFKQRWGQYFENNKNRDLGTFDYLSK